jgi:hypothetical protein
LGLSVFNIDKEEVERTSVLSEERLPVKNVGFTGTREKLISDCIARERQVERDGGDR